MAGSSTGPKQRTFVFLTQVYPPDPAALGQHLADAAEEMARRGHRVVVFTANRGFDDPSAKYQSREMMNGVDVRRLPLGSFGKRSIATRLVSGASLMIQEVVGASRIGGIDAVVVSTSPPLGPLAGAILSRIVEAPLKYWPMDVNPDQMVALGNLTAASPLVKVFDGMNRIVLRRASDVVALDDMMAAALSSKTDVASRITVVRPWAAEEPETSRPQTGSMFRKAHGLEGKVVVMHSGNHALSHPLTTILHAARRLRDDRNLVFAFVGGGVGKKQVEAEAGPNILSLPYQPRVTLTESLSAADVHIVSMGEGMAGIVHPSKIYGAMAVGRPIFFLGPRRNPFSGILAQADIGWHVLHGDVDGAERVLRSISSAAPAELAEKGMRARMVLDTLGTRASACGRVCDILER